MLTDVVSYLVVGCAFAVTVLRLFFEKPIKPAVPISHAKTAEMEQETATAPNDPSTPAVA